MPNSFLDMVKKGSTTGILKPVFFYSRFRFELAGTLLPLTNILRVFSPPPPRKNLS